MKKLDEMALEIEFLLISIIQGLALQMLASAALEPLGSFRFEYWGYIISAFALILIFWSQSIEHALSFIDWPIDLVHTFLYLLASFVEVMTFVQITKPFMWYVFGLIFLIIAGILYFYDLAMIKRHKKKFTDTPARKKLYDHMYTRQIKEMTYLLPGALLFNVVAAILVYVYPNYHVVLSYIQAVSSIIFLIIAFKAFQVRSQLLTDAHLHL